MTKEELSILIKLSIQKRRSEVIQALRNSNVEVSDSIGNAQLYDLIFNEFGRGNGYLVFNLEQVLNSEQLSLQQTDYSNIAPIIMLGISILPSLMGGGKKDDEKQSKAQAQAKEQMVMQYQMAQQQAQQRAEERREQLRREDEKAKRSTNMLIFGSVGVLVLLGLVGFIIYKKNK